MGDIRSMFADPQHPYTQLLISSLPKLDDKGALQGIPGVAPLLLNAPEGCMFHQRCPQAMEICARQTPILQARGVSRMVACHLYENNGEGSAEPASPAQGMVEAAQ